MPPAPRRRRPLFALVPSLLALVALEIGLRIYEALAPARDLAAIDVTEIRRRKDAGEFARRAGETLVFVYGESTVWGIPCPEIGLVAQLQFHASRAAPEAPVRFVNLGARSADSAIVRSVVEETIGAKPNLAIVLCGHNEFVRPDAGSPEPAGVLRHVAIARMAARTAARISYWSRTRIVPEGFNLAVARDERFARAEERYRENMAAIVAEARFRGVPVVLAALPSNLRDWPPVFRRLAGSPEGYQDAMETALAAADGGDTAALRSIVDAWQARLPDDAMVRFLRGRLRLAEGDSAGALDDLRAARDLDPIPCRMTSAFMAGVRDLAGRDGGIFVDLDGLLCRSGSIPGLELFVDNCHPSPDGGNRIASELLTQAGLLREAAREPPLGEFLGAAGYVKGSELRLRYLVANGQYAMRRPLYHYPIAHRYLTTALLEYPGSWLAHANMATLLLLLDDVEGGKRELAEAARLRPGPVDVTDEASVPYLGEAMAMRGLR